MLVLLSFKMAAFHGRDIFMKVNIAYFGINNFYIYDFRAASATTCIYFSVDAMKCRVKISEAI